MQDPFLHEWDERFHMLVARNAMDHPFTPTLLKHPMLRTSPEQWTLANIWLHKQPLFVWQMALSMKVFGVSALAGRLPSVVLGALMVPLLYSIGKSMTGNKNVGCIAAIIFCFSGFQFEQISGAVGMDHNDVAFSFYILASIWAYTRYERSPRLVFVLLVGLFAGCAILTKWLAGMLVYAGWGLAILMHLRSSGAKRDVVHLLVAVLCTLIVCLPWQIYIHHAFPVVAQAEEVLNLRHLNEVVEGHGGSNFFYLERFPNYFGEIGWFLVPAGCVVYVMQLKKGRIENRKIAIAMITNFVTTFIFFSYIARTKIIGFYFIAVPLGVVFIAIACVELIRQFEINVMHRAGIWVSTVLIVVIVLSILNPEHILGNHDPRDENRQHKIANVAVYKNLKKLIPDSVKVVVNANKTESIQAMFYNSDIRVFDEMAEKYLIDSLIGSHVPFAAFESRPDYVLPDSLEANPRIFVIHTRLEETRYL
jgi:4-amino-4-deoxy-L-arabinose transferase-like glycosyltransferase